LRLHGVALHRPARKRREVEGKIKGRRGATGLGCKAVVVHWWLEKHREERRRGRGAHLAGDPVSEAGAGISLLVFTNDG